MGSILSFSSWMSESKTTSSDKITRTSLEQLMNEPLQSIRMIDLSQSLIIQPNTIKENNGENIMG